MGKNTVISGIVAFSFSVGGAIAGEIGTGITCINAKSGEKIDFFYAKVSTDGFLMDEKDFVGIKMIVDDWKETSLGEMGWERFGGFAFSAKADGFRNGYIVLALSENFYEFSIQTSLINFGNHAFEIMDWDAIDYNIDRVTGEYLESGPWFQEGGPLFGYRGKCAPMVGDIKVNFQKYADQIETANVAESTRRSAAAAAAAKPKVKKF